MAVFGASALYWLASGVGLYLIGYVLVRWRKSARGLLPDALAPAQRLFVGSPVQPHCHVCAVEPAPEQLRGLRSGCGAG
jgi:hypothetical protein